MTVLREAAKWIADADRVLITAGAGLSAAAGFDYADSERFAELFPVLHRAGLRTRYEMIGRDLPPEYLWGFWAVHTNDIRFNPTPSPVYQRLRDIVCDRDYFVMTSNVDQFFSRNGFDAERVYTPQGDYGLYQCLTPCTREAWPSEPIVRAALDAYDPSTGKVAPESIPSCPNCGGQVFLNVYAVPLVHQRPLPPRPRPPQYLAHPDARKQRLARRSRNRRWIQHPWCDPLAQ